MKYLDLTLPSPAENLACDEALLDLCEAGAIGESLRFWESQQYFVVVGYGNAIGTEVNASACQASDVPILRRCSGGGTVVQGPGCLNYSLVLQMEKSSELQNITAANRFIMERNRRALEAVVNRPVTVRGHTDLAMDGVKFSGNAQRRRKNCLLFHGSLLLDFDLKRISELLPMPSKEPDYRQNRAHKDFVTNLAVPANLIKEALRAAWNATNTLPGIPNETIASLVRDKYATNDWNFKF
ncbi:MAG: lipoate--protein ligase family protein [Verrucomicrobiota bacterium]